MIGYAFMGAAHSQAWRTRPASSTCRYARDDGALRPGRGRGRGGGRSGWAGESARPTGARWSRATTSTSSTSARPATPTPRSRSPRSRPASTCCARSRWRTRSAEAEAMTGGRRRPRAARRAVDGRLQLPPGARRSRWRGSWSPRAGSATIRHVRAQYLQDWIVDPEFPLAWRLQKDRAGSGALGDIGAHIIDLAQFVTGAAARPVSRRHRDVRRPSARCRVGSAVWPPAAARGRSATVTVDDAAVFIGRLRRRRAGHLRGDPVRDRAQERAAASRSTARAAASRSTSRR